MDHNKNFEITLDKLLVPINHYRRNEAITEIMINGYDEIYVEEDGKLRKTTDRFPDQESLLAAVRNIAQFTNKRIAPNTARFDSRLPDGSRVHVIMPRCSPRKGLCVAIRKFSEDVFTLDGLVKSNSLSAEAKEYIEIVVELEKNLIVAGGTGTGKTSLLNAVSSRIPEEERIIVIEDSSELQLDRPHVLYFETAPPDRHGEHLVGIRELFHSALRMRPDRIVIGECRGGEALDLIQSMTSGHRGSMSTLHATTPFDALNRLETMALMSEVKMPLSALQDQIASAIDVIVQLIRLKNGRRMVSEICEVGNRVTAEGYEIRKIFSWDKPTLDSAKYQLIVAGEKSGFGAELSKRNLGWKSQLTREIFFDT
jgi:pilus assembly protein CpaF